MNELPIFLSKCEVWSDGEEHDDHNSSYDFKYFYILKNTDRVIIYSWNSNMKPKDGIVTDWTIRQHLDEINNEINNKIILSGTMKISECKNLVEKELNRYKKSNRNKESRDFMIRVLTDFLALH